MAQNRFLTALETVYEGLDALATTAEAKFMTGRLKSVLSISLDLRSDVGINHVTHPMYMYARQGLDANRAALLGTVRGRLTDTERADETIQNGLHVLFEDNDAEPYTRMTFALRRFRAWRTVLMADSESE
jgi:fructose-bisphosphate aldolase class 1